MTGVKSFVLGFSLSLFSVSLCGQLLCSTPVKKRYSLSSSTRIDLFKKNDTVVRLPASSTVFADITKQSLDVADVVSSQGEILSPEGIEDDEILNLSSDDNIPIEYNVSTTNIDNSAEILNNDNFNTEEKTAMLPTDLSQDRDNIDSPWVIAKGAPSIKNKRLAEDLEKISDKHLFADNFQKTVNNSDDVSYKVAQTIKRSIIFPIPDEILNDENLTPTFINEKANKSPSAPKAQQTTRQSKAKPSPSDDINQLEIISNEKIKTTDNSKGFLGSISSWFSDKPSIEKETAPAHKKATPSYSTQDNSASSSLSKSSEDLASFYESLQNTQKEFHQRKIVPSELRLFFQPGRAEISGSTLRWLKTFSDAAQDDDTFLQINLDASASTDLQKKRLDLLYTILVNNGVDFRKVDTNFSLTEPNAFVIRTIKSR